MADASAGIFGTSPHEHRRRCTSAIAQNVESSLRPRLVSRSLFGETPSRWYAVIPRSGRGQRPPDIRWNVPSAAIADRACGIRARVTPRRSTSRGDRSTSPWTLRARCTSGRRASCEASLFRMTRFVIPKNPVALIEREPHVASVSHGSFSRRHTSRSCTRPEEGSGSGSTSLSCKANLGFAMMSTIMSTSMYLVGRCQGDRTVEPRSR